MQIYADKVFNSPIDVIKAFDNKGFKQAFEKLENLKKRYYLVGYVRYNAYKIFQNIEITSNEPLLYFEAYRDYSDFEAAPLAHHKTYAYPKVSKADYFANIDYIKEQIACGNTYEVNYTFPNVVWVSCSGKDLFLSLISEQKTPYNAYIKNEFEEVLSFSPELFFKVKGGRIYTKPMKGTIKRGSTPKEDNFNREFLQNDEKNRAENVMIVDLLRNDLGRIAKTGTVNVDKLFEIETHKTLHQMTSEISAELEDGAGLYEIFKAIYPCGSITGAPKVSTMKIIEEIEPEPRGIYCGAIGYIHGEECEFSVPIRILQRKSDEPFYTCHTGGAVVWDSTAEEEWNEALLKSSFLKTPIAFIDTMAVKNGKILFEKEHRERLNVSVEPAADNEIIRIVSLNSEYNVQHLPLNPLTTNIVKIAQTTVDSANPLLSVKTDFRPWYDATMQKVRRGELFDEIYFNERGELTEGARSNVIIEKGGNFYTPPLSCGLLNGIYRQNMLKEGRCVEKILYKEDLLCADAVYCCNSVRGLVKVCLS